MTTYHLNFWTSPRGDISRIYVNGSDGSTAGYLQQREFGEYTSRWSHTLSDDVFAALVSAAAEHRHIGMSGDIGEKFVTLRDFCRGMRWVGPKSKKAELKKLADNFTFTA